MELKPCPYCGADARMWGIGNTIWIGCRGNDCVETHICATAGEAADTWNKRAETPEAAELAALKADMEAGRLVSTVCDGCVHDGNTSDWNPCWCCERKSLLTDHYEPMAVEQEGQDG